MNFRSKTPVENLSGDPATYRMTVQPNSSQGGYFLCRAKISKNKVSAVRYQALLSIHSPFKGVFYAASRVSSQHPSINGRNIRSYTDVLSSLSNRKHVLYKRLKKLTLFAVLITLSVFQVHANEKKIKTTVEWQVYFGKDAKLRSLIQLLGKPDDIEQDSSLKGREFKRYTWFRKVDSGKNTLDQLSVYTLRYRHEVIVTSMRDPLDSMRAITFPWEEKIIAERQKETDQLIRKLLRNR